MNAKNARALAKEAVISEIAEITEKIIKESKKGLTRMSITPISQGAMAYLKDEGYDVQEYYVESYSSVIISW
jgi:hypothetical protein